MRGVKPTAAPDETVREAREMYAAGQLLVSEIAAFCGYAERTVSAWISGESRLAAGGPVSARLHRAGTKSSDVTKDYDVNEGGCWLWRGTIDRNGYPRVKVDSRHWGAHRLAWTRANGEIPERMTVDHLCFTPACVNPDHLQLLSHSENSKRRRNILRETCAHGHARTAENTAIEKNGLGREYRACLLCKRARYHRAQALKRGEVA